jgi:hypothetical protein
MTIMRNHWTMSVCGVLMAAAIAAAQPPPATRPPVSDPVRPQPQDPTPVPSAKPPELQKPQAKPAEPAPAGRLTRSELKLTGCLQRGESPTAASPEASPAGDRAPLASGFVLRHATPTRSDDMKESGASSGTPSGTKEYRLVAKDDSVKLADHVGHQVSITGQVALANETPGRASTDASTSASRPSGSAGVATPASGAAAISPAVTVTVSSLSMVSQSCSTPAS